MNANLGNCISVFQQANRFGLIFNGIDSGAVWKSLDAAHSAAHQVVAGKLTLAAAVTNAVLGI